jgi:hypothetical protein
MNKISCLLLLLILPGILFSQVDPEVIAPHSSSDLKQEIKVNILDLLIVPAIGITYERYINQPNGYRNEKIELAPFYRIYFQKKKKESNKGLFTELFSGINLGKVEYYWYQDDIYEPASLYSQEYLGIAMGATLGYKFDNFNNFTFEISLGAGRYLNKQEVEAYPRVNFSIGKRF